MDVNSLAPSCLGVCCKVAQSNTNIEPTPTQIYPGISFFSANIGHPMISQIYERFNDRQILENFRLKL